MKALLLNCTLKPSPEKSNTEALAEVVADALRADGVEVASVRAVDHSIPPGVETEMGEGDEWPGVTRKPKRVTSGRTPPAGPQRRTCSLEAKPIPAPPSEERTWVWPARATQALGLFRPRDRGRR